MIVHRPQQTLAVVLSLIVFGVALEVLRIELRTVGWHALSRDVVATPWPRLAAALALTALNYAVLTGYDIVAFRYIRREIPVGRIAGVAFLAYALSHSIGFPALSGASIRYRFYSRWGISAEELARIVFSYSLTFWMGLSFLGGLSLLLGAPPAGLAPLAAWLARPLGVLLLAAVGGLLAATVVRRAPLRIRHWSIVLPSPPLAVVQLALSCVDWVVAGAVLFVLLPPGRPPFLTFLGAFLVSVLLGMVSHVPGGVGVFEGLMVWLLRPWLRAPELMPALVVYRAVYYLLPFGLGLVGLVADELRQHRAHLTRAAGWMGHITGRVTPRALSAFTFFSGIVLLVSGATPAAPGRLDVINRLLPLGVIEVSHLLGSVAGAGLLVLAHGLARRLDAAYYLSVGLIVVGVTTSLFKGGDIEEALVLIAVLAILHRARPAFDRRAAFFATRFSPSWLAAIIGALGASIWLGLFAFKHVDYAANLWWRVELVGEASRFLRASIGASVVVLLVAMARLLRPAPHAITLPDTATLADAARIIEAQPATAANLVFLRDKGVLFDAERQAFLMYGVQGRTWVGLHDPVGPPARRHSLIREFLERADDYDATPVFYEVAHDGLHHYADYGLTFARLGEEAYVDLRTFSTDGGAGSTFRQAVRRLDREGGAFRVIAAADVPRHLPRLREISDEWLADKAAAEKGFSLGFFDDAYVSRFPLAVIERAGRIEVFATMWPGAGQAELSVDLMRFSGAAPKGVMEALLTHVMVWGRDQGYQRCALGMAPLSGFERSPVAPLWQRIGALIYEHGEPVYGFQGLRAFKEKFHPLWEPRYLAYPGGLALPRILADVSALIAGGYRRIFTR